MVLAVGEAPQRGRWYWVNTAAPEQNPWGSLNWWKDDDDAVFLGMGEVQKYGWVNGSSQLCSSPAFVCLQYFSAELPGYGGVTFTGGSDPPVSMIQDSGDHWHCNYTHGAYSYRIDAEPGTQSPGCMSFAITDQNGLKIYQQPFDLNHGTHTYRFFSYSGVPAAFPAQTNLLTLIPGFTPPSVYTHGWKKANTASSLTVTWPVSLPSGMPVLYLVYQHGTDVSGGTLGTPPVLSGGSVLLGSSDFRLTLIYAPSVGPGTTTVFPISNAADICWVSAYAIAGSFMGLLDTHNVLVNQPTTLNPSITCATPTVTPGIQGYGIMTWRTALTSGTVPTPNTYTIMDTNNGPDASNVVGGTPLFEGAGLASGGQKYSSSPFAGATCHTITSEKFNAMFFNCH